MSYSYLFKYIIVSGPCTQLSSATLFMWKRVLNIVNIPSATCELSLVLPSCRLAIQVRCCSTQLGGCWPPAASDEWGSTSGGPEAASLSRAPNKLRGPSSSHGFSSPGCFGCQQQQQHQLRTQPMQGACGCTVHKGGCSGVGSGPHIQLSQPYLAAACPPWLALQVWASRACCCSSQTSGSSQCTTSLLAWSLGRA